ncbi:MAG TPA: DUF2341 domain-containing protein [Candidatus Acidoferrales bacterium]|nr:DUF2341 domain-containing protein [Candidatus Acidoferrales bacterium]
MRRPRFLPLFLLAAPVWAQCPGGYLYQRSIAVNTGQVSGTLASFPMLVLNPSASLKSSANGGHVQNANGYDIVFVSSGGARLPFELVGHAGGLASYDPASGNAEFWVNVASISDGTTIYMCYGNPAIGTYQGNDSATWTGFSGVWHQNDSAANTTVTDSLGMYPGATTSNTSVLGSAGGKIGRGFNFGGSDSASFGNALPAAVNGAAKLSFSMWSNVAAPLAYASKFQVMDASNHGVFWLNLDTNDVGCPGNGRTGLFIGVRQGVDNQNDAYHCGGLTNGVWQLLSFVFDGSQSTNDTRLKVYVNGAQQTLTYRGSIGSSISLSSGSALLGAGYNGLTDELHVLVGTAEQPGWIATEYNNQSSPASFYTVGSESAVAAMTAISASPQAVPAISSGNVVLTLTGTSTAWTGGTTFSISGVSGVTKIAQSVLSATSATLTITTGAGTGSLTISDGTTSTTILVGMGGSGCAVVGIGG